MALAFAPALPDADVLASDLFEVFWEAHSAAADLHATLTPAQSAGVQPLPFDLERLDGEARAARNALLNLAGIDPDDDQFGPLDGLYDRPCAVYDGPTGMSDWSRSRRAS